MADSFLVLDGGSGSAVSTEVDVDSLEVADDNLSTGEGATGAADGPVNIVLVGGSNVGDSSVANLKDLNDVVSSNLGAGVSTSNRFVLTYNATTDKFEFINPDAVIDAAVGVNTMSPPQTGLSTATIDYLDDALDNKIDLDAGEW